MIQTQQFKPLFEKIDGLLLNGNLILAIDGCAAAGKSTLGAILAGRYDCALFHADDFFLRPEQRSLERLNEPGGNMDRERLKAEVLEPLKKGETVTFRPFDCKTMSLKEPVTVQPTKLCVVEGAYSMHPELQAYYGLSVFLDIEPELQMQRVIKRGGEEKAKQFASRWIPMENRYFEAFNIKEKCAIKIKTHR